MMAPLAPPKNVRLVKRRCCANCAYRKNDECGDMYCDRDPDGVPWGIGNDPETGIHYAVCDGFKIST